MGILLLACTGFVPVVGHASSHHVSFYAGQGTRSSIHDVLFEKEFEDSWFAGVGAGKTVKRFSPALTLEVEGNILQHMGKQGHGEVAAAPVARWHSFPWNRTVRTTAAVGLGLSYATGLPRIEQEKNGKSNTLLVFLPVEMTAAPAGDAPWEAVLRIHHRSGAWGVVGPRGGSNFPTLGMRYRF